MDNENVIEIENVDMWESIIEQGEKPSLVMFYSPNCPNCRVMEPYFFEYAKKFKEKTVFLRVNIQNNLIIAAKYGVLGTPTFKFFCKNHPIQENVGQIYPTLIKKMVEDGLHDGEKCASTTTWIEPTITGYG